APFLAQRAHARVIRLRSAKTRRPTVRTHWLLLVPRIASRQQKDSTLIDRFLATRSDLGEGKDRSRVDAHQTRERDGILIRDFRRNAVSDRIDRPRMPQTHVEVLVLAQARAEPKTRAERMPCAGGGFLLAS